MTPTTSTTGPRDTADAPGRRVLIFANPFSGSGPNRKWVDALVDSLEMADFEPRVVWDRDERRAVLGDPSLGASCRCVISAGGDGSLADVVNELAADVPVATLPMGNENLFAAHFAFGRHGERLADAVARGRTRRIDLGALERKGQPPRLFTLMSGIGFDADVVHRLDRWRTASMRATGELRRVSRISYMPRILGSLREYGYTPVTLEADGRRVTGAHAFVFNLPCYGMDLGLAPDACGDSGRLHWVVFERPGMIRLARYGMLAFFKRHYGSPGVHHGSAERVTLSADGPVPVQADGDPAGTTPLTIAVRPAALQVIDAADG